jgi:NAD(P)-dependent dehydrogenase (short-subunit alcohol dehydrogenase family)
MTRDTILVTGASTGLGKAMALHLADRGFKVYASVRGPDGISAVEEAAAQRDVEVSTLTLDVTDRDSVQAGVERIVSESGGIYGVINNAGVGLRGYFEDLTDTEIRELYEANVFGVMAVTRAVLPHMRAAGRGRVIMISSVGGRIGSLAVSAYCSTKFALEGFGESLYMELAPLGIEVVIIEPGIIKTERWSINRGTAAGALNPDSPYHEWFKQSETESDMLVQASTATPDDVAEVVHRALRAAKPRLRYMVGRKAKLAVWLRRLLPGELFERLYFGLVMRRVTRSSD